MRVINPPMRVFDISNVNIRFNKKTLSKIIAQQQIEAMRRPKINAFINKSESINMEYMDKDDLAAISFIRHSPHFPDNIS